MARFALCIAAIASIASLSEAFVPSSSIQRRVALPLQQQPLSTLSAAGGKKKRRRRKQPPTQPTVQEDAPAEVPSMPEAVSDELVADEIEGEVNVDDILDVAKFEFDGEISMGEGTFAM